MRKSGLKSLLLAMGLALASSGAVAQEAAPANTAAPAVTAPTDPAAAATPAPATPATATPAAAATPAANPPAPALVRPETGIGQPVDRGIGLPEQVSPTGKTALWLHDVILMPIIVLISLFVLALLFWVSWRYRRAAHPVPSKTTHNTFIEVLWTVVPVLILVVIAVPSIGLLSAQYKPAPANALTIKAIGNQWYWSYEYPDNGAFSITANMLKEAGDPSVPQGGRTRTVLDGPRLLAVDNRIVVPVGRPVRLIVTSNDVIHSWSLPAAWVKMDAVPGRLNEVNFQIDRPGVYFGQCSELCGARHAYMPIAVEAVSDAQFNQWVLAQGGTLGGPAPSAPAPTEADTTQTLDPANEAAITPAVNGTAAAAPATNQAATANPAGAGNVE